MHTVAIRHAVILDVLLLHPTPARAMSRSNTLNNVLTGTLVLCAILVTGAVTKQTFFPRRAIAAAALPAPRTITGWEKLADEGNVVGGQTSPLKIVYFSDFQCPYCADLRLALDTLQARHPRQIQVVYRHFPVPGHVFARDAAVASECAAQQGRFDPYHAALFQHQDSLGAIPWVRIAVESSVPDTARFQRCRTEPWAAGRVAADEKMAQSLGITGTPSIIIGDELVAAALPVDSLSAWLTRRGATLR